MCPILRATNKHIHTDSESCLDDEAWLFSCGKIEETGQCGTPLGAYCRLTCGECTQTVQTGIYQIMVNVTWKLIILDRCLPLLDRCLTVA